MSGILISWSENGASSTQAPQRLAMVSSCLLLLTLVATEVARPRSGQGLRCTNKDQSEEIEHRALISAITFLSMTFHNYDIAELDSWILQDYNNKASVNELLGYR